MDLDQQVINNIISRIKILIREKKLSVGEHKPGEAWQYEGDELGKQFEDLKAEIHKSGYAVLNCNAFHFVKNARVRTPTDLALLIPVNGTISFASGEALSHGNAYYIEEPQSLIGEDWDIIIAALRKTDSL